jgi:hypothetical protein
MSSSQLFNLNFILIFHLENFVWIKMRQKLIHHVLTKIQFQGLLVLVDLVKQLSAKLQQPVPPMMVVL